MSDISPSGEPNVPGFVEDSNSPFAQSGQSSHTIQVSDPKDIQVVYFDNLITTQDEMLMQFNGETSGVYDYASEDGTFTTGASSIPVNEDTTGSRTGTGKISYTGVFQNNFGMRNSLGATPVGGPVAAYAKAFSIGSPVTQFTVFNNAGENFGLTARIYGLNIK